MKNSITVILLLTLLGSGTMVSAQTDKQAWKSIYGEVFVNSEINKNMKHLSYEIGGRMTGTQSCWKAEDFIAQKFSEYGLVNVKKEPYELLAWERVDIKAELVTPLNKELYAVSMGNTPSTPENGITRKVIDVGHGHKSEMEKVKRDIKGNIILLDTGTVPGEKRLHRSEKMCFAEEFSAAGFIMINSTEGNIPRTGTVKMGELSKIPGIGISKEHGEWLRWLIKNEDNVKLKLKVLNKSYPSTSHNVCGEIKGTEKPDEVVIVGGHLDSWDLGQGTIDNGTGIVVILEAARVLSAINQKPKRTIRFIAFTGEELGIYGSRAYVQTHINEMKNIIMMMNLDMPGNPSGYNLIGADEAVPYFTGLAGSLKKFGMDPDNIRSGWWLHSDHQYFMLEGVPSISISGSLRPNQGRYYHTAGDTYDKFTEIDQNKTAAVVSITLFEIADCINPPSVHNTKNEVKQAMIDNDLKDTLIREGAWK